MHFQPLFFQPQRKKPFRNKRNKPFCKVKKLFGRIKMKRLGLGMTFLVQILLRSTFYGSETIISVRKIEKIEKF